MVSTVGMGGLLCITCAAVIMGVGRPSLGLVTASFFCCGQSSSGVRGRGDWAIMRNRMPPETKRGQGSKIRNELSVEVLSFRVFMSHFNAGVEVI